MAPENGALRLQRPPINAIANGSIDSYESLGSFPVPLPEPIGMMDLLAGDEVIGSVHADGRGWVAWDQGQVWLGKSERSRFRTGEDAIAAIEAAYTKRNGRPVVASGWRAAR